jgi:Rieske Fe-S protein
MILHLKKFSLVVVGLLFLGSCSKNNSANVIPNVLVDVVININEPSSFELQPIGGWVYVNGGSRGLLVYHANEDEFICYDRHSTYDVNAYCQTNVDSTGFKILDPCSGSVFSIFDGNPIQGPATIGLKSYPTSFDGTYLVIRN